MNLNRTVSLCERKLMDLKPPEMSLAVISMRPKPIKWFVVDDEGVVKPQVHTNKGLFSVYNKPRSRRG